VACQQLDPIDVRILETLQGHGRITNQALADQVGLSPSACLVRVRKLEAEGVIGRYLAEVEIDQLERVIEAFIEVHLINHDRSELDRFEGAMVAEPHVVACHRVSGRYDYLLRVIAGDMEQLREVADRLLSSGLGVATIATTPVLAKIKPFSGYPLERVLRGSR
jgi:DNA-binding Lrp family transcriptional regulator